MTLATSLQAATDDQKRTILSLIDEFVHGRSAIEIYGTLRKGIDLRLSDGKPLSVAQLERDPNGEIAQIHVSRKLDKNHSHITNYHIFETPEGYAVKKKITFWDNRAFPFLDGGESREKKSQIIQSALEQCKKHEDADKREAALGLHFFSYDDAEEVVTLLRDARPY